jgi:hypothetical protein
MAVYACIQLTASVSLTKEIHYLLFSLAYEYSFVTVS